MEKLGLYGCFLLVLLLRGVEVEGLRSTYIEREIPKLYVFGDSYADTGNAKMRSTPSWKAPYGMTVPGRPTGRWSDGSVMTDVLASLMGTRSPISYQWRKTSPKRLSYGMNFAYGGTGVFDTFVPLPNLTAQIDLFQETIKEGLYSQSDVQSSITLVSVAGNDYTTYQAKNGTVENVMAFTESLIKQLVVDLKRLQSIGVRKIIATALPPFGCLPGRSVASSYTKCNDTLNQLAAFHNLLLQSAVEDLNKGTANGQKVVILDLYNAFLSKVQSKPSQGSSTSYNLLKPCCEGISGDYKCGDVDANGKNMYTVCESPKTAFFWDRAHPTHSAWGSISSFIRSTIEQLH